MSCDGRYCEARNKNGTACRRVSVVVTYCGERLLQVCDMHWRRITDKEAAKRQAAITQDAQRMR